MDDKLALILAYGCEDLTGWMSFWDAHDEARVMDAAAAEDLRSDFG